MVKSLVPLRILLICIGLEPPNYFQGTKSTIFKMYKIILYILFFTYAFLFAPSAYISRFDSGLFAQYTSIVFYGHMCVFEIIYLLIYKKELLDILNYIENEFITLENNFGRNIKEKCKQKEFSFMINIALMQVPVFIGSIIFAIFKESSPDDAKLNIHLGKKNPERTIPYMVWIPYDETISPYFEITSVLIYTCLFTCASVMHLLIVVLPIIIIHLTGQFKMISYMVEHFANDEDNKESGTNKEINNFEQNKNVEISLIRVIQAHQKLLRFSSRIINFFRPLILLKTTFYFGILSVLLFAVSTTPFGSKNYVQSLTCSFGFTAELFFLCLYGEDLSGESQQVSIAAYRSLWYKFSDNAKKALSFMMLRSQSPVQLDGESHFIIVGLKTYIQIFQASFSYFTVLRRVHDKNLHS